VIKKNNYFYIEIDNNISKVEIFLTTSLLNITNVTKTYDDQNITIIDEGEEEEIVLNSSLTTELELNAYDSHAMRIRFFYMNEYRNVLKQFIKSLEPDEDVGSAVNDTSFNVFIIKLYRKRRTYIIGYEKILGVRLYFIPLIQAINRRFLQSSNSTALTQIKYELANDVSEFNIVDLIVKTPIVTSVADGYNISLRIPVIESGPAKESLDTIFYNFTLYIFSNTISDDVIDLKNGKSLSKLNFTKRSDIDETEGDYMVFFVNTSEQSEKLIEGNSYKIAATAQLIEDKSDETKKQDFDYTLTTLSIGKYYGNTSSNDYNPTNTFTKINNKREGNKSKWWIALIVLAIIILIVLIVWLVCKKLKTDENNEEEIKNPKEKNVNKNQRQESHENMMAQTEEDKKEENPVNEV